MSVHSSLPNDIQPKPKDEYITKDKKGIYHSFVKGLMYSNPYLTESPHVDTHSLEAEFEQGLTQLKYRVFLISAVLKIGLQRLDR